ILGDLGAEVLKIEPPGGVRTRAGHPQVNGISYDFHFKCCDKKSVTLDLSTQRGRALFLELIGKVDIVVENFGPWTMPKLGLGYDVLAKANPRLIYASIKGYGLSGPSSHKGGNDGVVQAASGMACLSGWPGRDPVRAGLSAADRPAGTFTPIPILAALYYRQRSGKGQFIDMSMHDIASWGTQQAWPVYFGTGRSPGPIGNRHRLFAPNNSYRARDGLLVIGVESDAEWESLVRVTGREDLLEEERYGTVEGRYAAIDEVDAIVGEWVGQLTVQEAVERCQRARVPAGPILDMPEALSHLQTQARGLIVEVPVDGERVRITAPPYKLSRTPPRVERGAPRAGQHTEEVLRGVLGLSDEEITGLRQERNI
ncbi:MAG: CoA transferase, partial [Chloroflexi bacterium]|nr:CoA transferase [Chloroflexota bacterium]